MSFSAIIDFLKAACPNEKDRHVAGILFLIMGAISAAYLIVIGTAIYWRDQVLIFLSIAGVVLNLVPLALLFRGQVYACGFVLTLNVLLTVTLINTSGLGIHDVGIMAYPVIVTIASLILRRREFLICSTLTLVAIAWLVFGEMLGVVKARPVDAANLSDYLVMASMLLVSILASDLLSRHMRKNLRQAEQEIYRREILEEQLRYQSTHDALTGIFNRAFFEAELERLKQGRDYPVSIIAADLNNLKTLNDTQGHIAGDELLRQTARVLGEVFRAEDVLARIGGDEFAVLLARTDEATAECMLERIRLRIAEYNRDHPDLPLQIALGYSTAEAGHLAEAIVVADQHMYAEKALQKSKLLETL